MTDSLNTPEPALQPITLPDPLDMHGACDGFGGSDFAPVEPEPPPAPNDGPSMWDLVVSDMRARDEFGRRKYGTTLQADNGRDPLVDAYQEALDLAVYLRQAIEERKHTQVDAAIAMAVRYGGIDGAHHKTWVIDQMVRLLAGSRYDQVVADACSGEDGPHTWEEGIAP